MLTRILGIKSRIKSLLNPGKGQLFSGINDYMMNVSAETIRADPELAPLLETANSWWGPTGCVIVGIAGVEENVHLSMEFCVLSEDTGAEGNLITITDIDTIKESFKDWDPLLTKLLNLVDKARVWRLAYTEPGLNWTRPDSRVILIGDAAHAMLPHAMAVSLQYLHKEDLSPANTSS